MDIESQRSVRVKLHWGKLKLEFDFDRLEGVDELKAKLYSLTNVHPDKQKILYKGKYLKEDSQIQSLQVKEGEIFMLMGSAEGKGMDLEKVTQKMFVEDMTEEQIATHYQKTLGETLYFGIENLGNTCYLNSSIQVMRRMPELRSPIVNREYAKDVQPAAILLQDLAGVIDKLEKSGKTVNPASFVNTFMQVYPQFAEKEQHGGFQQQDADECFQNMLATIEPALKVKNQSLIDKMFSFEIKYKISNAENSEEPDSFHFENMRKLSCIIDNQNIPINMLSEGIQAGLVGEIEKYSDLLERNAIFHRKGEIASLPDYLIIQKIRFIWKDSDNSTKNKATKAKVLRQVIFPRVLDIAPFCTDELKSSFIPLRESDKKKEAQKSESLEAEFEEYKKQFTGDFDSLKINKKFRESKKEQEIKEHDAKLWADLSQGKPNGNYELVGVITHKGRSADSGHYVGWTQDKGDDWNRFDDDIVSKVKIEDVEALRGGGDWHMAYLLVYRKLVTQL